VRRLFRRCTAGHFDGRIVGFRACKPRHRIKNYRRRAKLAKLGPGLLGKVFEDHPRIESELTELALTGARPCELRRRLLELAETSGVAINEYPRSADEGARKALKTWKAKLIDSHGRGMTDADFGKDAANNFDDGTEAWQPDIDPHCNMTFDEYTPDVFTCIEVLQTNGASNWSVMSRFKVVSGKRRGSRDVCVAHRVLRKAPDVAKFLDAVELAIRPHQRRNFTIEGFGYPDQPCFASDFAAGSWLLFDLVFLDRSRVHLAAETRLTLTRDLGCIIVYGVPRRPKARSDIEAWHSVLSRIFQELSMTVGKGPGDPKRRDPEATALKCRFQEDHVAQIIELATSRFNVSRLKSLKGHTPMEDFQRWSGDENTILRHLPIPQREAFSLATVRVPVHIWCDRRTGRQPVVKYKYAEYVGPKLAHMQSRNGDECVLIFNRNTAHIARLYTSEGKTELDVVHTRGEWNCPHRLSDREDYRKRMKCTAQLSGDSASKIILGIKAHFEGQKKLSKDDALKYAEFIGNHPEFSSLKTESVSNPMPNDGDEELDDELPNKLSSAGDW
jgi:putative transposase